MLRDEKLQYQTQLGQVVDKIGSQIEQLDRKIEAEGPPIPFEIATPPSGSPRQEVQQLVMAPGLPHFSGTEPTPRDEGTYDQWKYQVKGMWATCPDSAVRSALITSLRGEASELVGFVGFNAPMSVILEAIDKRFGKRATTARLKLKELFVKFHHIFALEDMELGKTDMVKHVICLGDQTPFRKRYRRIPPHQYDEVKKHLKEMLEIGAIRKSQSP